MAETVNRVMVPGYRHVPGHHCGSTALRNLLGFHGVEISEEMAFGLGAGACFYYIVLDEHSPSRFTNGRAARLEEHSLELTGAPLRLRTDPDPGGSWAARRGGRRLARGGRGLAVVCALPLPGDRAPRNRRGQLPPDVLALSRGGGVRGVRARARGRGELDEAGARGPGRERARRARSRP